MENNEAKHIEQLKKERPIYAEAAVREYLRAKGEEHTMPLCETDLSDLQADLYHLCDLLGFDIYAHDVRAANHYRAEKEEC